MTPFRAKEVLEGMGLDVFNEKLLRDVGFGLYVEAGRTAFLETNYTSDQLQAIALWMQDPEGVTNAYKPTDDWADPNPEGEKCGVTSVCHRCHVALSAAGK